MIRKLFVVLLFLCFGAALYAEVASAEVKADYGGSFRLRQEYWEKVTDLETKGQPDRDYFRLRTLLWGKVALDKDFGGYLRLGNEAKYYIGNYKPVFETGKTGENWDVDELYVDNIYIDYKNVLGMPIDLRIGRQDFIGPTGYGEGFLIIDGTPVDGSRSFYFNAVKATVRINKNNSVDLVYTSNTKTDQYMPSLYPARADGPCYSGNKRILNGSNEEGAWIYLRSKLNDNFSIEPYYIYKTEDPIGAIAKLKINTLGARAVFTNTSGWKIRGEFAHEFGKYDDTATVTGRDRKANGGYIFAGQKYEKILFKPEWELGYVYLSGDDPGTLEHEGWDPLFSRAPLWNELYIYTIIGESAGKEGFAAPAYWSNLHLYKLGVNLQLASSTKLCLSYQILRADRTTSGLDPAMFTNNSKDRGQMVTAMLTHAFTKHIDGFLQAEYFIPGDFYVDKAEKAAFLRWQLQYKF